MGPAASAKATPAGASTTSRPTIAATAERDGSRPITGGPSSWVGSRVVGGEQLAQVAGDVVGAASGTST